MSAPVRALRAAPASGWLLLLAPAAVALLGLAVRAQSMPNHDVAWLLIAAARMLAGGSYADDFFEVNMPLAVAAYIPPQLIARALHCSAALADAVWTVLLAVQSAWLSTRILAARGVSLPGGPALTAAGLLLGLVFLPGYDFGQKEHLVALLGLPFLFLLAGASAAAPSRPLRVYVSVLAAAGFFLKPHYAPLPFLLVAAAALRARSASVLRSPEALSLLAMAALNALLVALFYRDWLVVLHWAEDLYGGFRSDSWSKLLAVRGLPVAAACLIFQLGFAAVHRGFRAAAWPLLLASVYAVGAYLVQFTGWSYQFLPVRLLVFVGQVLALVLALGDGLRPMSRGGLLALALLGVTVEMGAAVRSTVEQPNEASLQKIPAAFAPAAAGSYVYAFSLEVFPPFPTVALMHLRWASRYSHLWPLAKLAGFRGKESPADQQRLRALYAGPLTAAVAQDFARYRPQVVLVDRRRFPGAPPDFDILALFLADPRFAAIWRSQYVLAGQVSYAPDPRGFDIFLRAPDGADPGAPASGAAPISLPP